jgi:hypothetical protein
MPKVGPEWSAPQPGGVVLLGGLGPGEHLVEVRAAVGDPWFGPSQTYRIDVQIPWWDRNDVQGLLLVAVVVAVGAWGVRRRRRLRDEHAAASEAAAATYQASLAEAETARQRSEWQTAKAMLDNQNQELASATLHLVEKAQLVKALEEGLRELAFALGNDDESKVKPLLDLIADSGRTDDAWEEFSERFNKVHLDFTKTLKANFPGLTPNDVKLCTYLKMNLTSKDIASLMFISVRAVEVSRSRLRKRMGLKQGEVLADVISAIAPPPKPS